MKDFGQLLGCLFAAVPIFGAIAAVIIAVQLIIAFFPVIIGLLVLLFLGYVFCLGLNQLVQGAGK